ncbi:MAG: GumC family protein [Deltaproteobacteria bacterium]|nr:GumC family protein [Deltaproteobacteria bacterium]
MDETEHDVTRGIPWRAVLDGVFRRRRLVLGVFAAGVLVTVLMALLDEPVYRATAKLMVTSERARITVSPDPKEGSRVEPVTDQDLNAEVALLRSPALTREVLDGYRARLAPPAASSALRGAVQMLRDVKQLPARLYRALHAVGEPDPLEEWVSRTAGSTNVVSVRGSNLIEATYDSPHPGWAAEFLNQLMDAHVARHATMRQQSAAQEFLGDQRELLHTRLTRAEAALKAFYAREGLDVVPEQGGVSRARLAELETALADANRELAESTARAGFLAQALESHPKGAVSDPASGRTSPSQVVQGRLLELELERSKLLTEYAPTSIKIRDLDRQIADARRLAAQARNDMANVNPSYLSLTTELTQTRAQGAALQARVAALEAQIADYRRQLGHLDGVASEHEQLQQEVASAKEAYLTYLKKEEEARFSAALDESRIVNVSIVERATPPTVPLPTKVGLNLLLGALVSALLALAAGYLRDRLDPSVKTAADAARVAGLPVLADLPS